MSRLAGFSLAVVVLVSLIRLSSSLYLPAMPAMERELSLPDHDLATTMTIYSGFFAGAAVFLGPMADALGRRWLVFGGLAIFLIGTWACSVADGLGLLLVGRALQGLGGSSIPVTTRAMVRDACDDAQLLQVMGWIGVLNGLAPLMGPVLGGAITEMAGWRANFEVLLAVGAAVAVLSWPFLPETLPPERRVPLGLASSLRTYGRMLVSPLFMGVLAPALVCFVLQGIYLTMAPFVLMSELHLSPVQFGLSTIPLVVGLMAGRSLCMRLVKSGSDQRAYVLSGVIVLASGVVGLLVAVADWRTVAGLLLPTTLFCVGFGSLLLIGQKSVMTAFQDVGGTASALHASAMLAASAAGNALGAFFLAGPGDGFRILCAAPFVGGILAVAACGYGRRHLI